MVLDLQVQIYEERYIIRMLELTPDPSFGVVSTHDTNKIQIIRFLHKIKENSCFVSILNVHLVSHLNEFDCDTIQLLQSDDLNSLRQPFPSLVYPSPYCLFVPANQVIFHCHAQVGIS